MYAFHYVSLLYGFNPCTTPHIPFSSLPAPRKSFLNLNLEYLPVCFSSSSLKPTALPHINQIGAAGLIHLSMGAPIPSEEQPAPSLGDPRSQLPVSAASPKPPDNLYWLAMRGIPSHGTDVKLTKMKNVKPPDDLYQLAMHGTNVKLTKM